MTREEAHFFIQEHLGFCGCGQPEPAIKLLRLLLLAFDYRKQDYAQFSKWLDRLLPATGLRYFVLYQLSRAKLLEHGSSIDGAWLTPAGYGLLAALSAYTPEEIDELDN